MRTWSAESAFIKAYSLAAVGIQCAIDAAKTLERTTRPMGHDKDEFDESAAEAFLGEPIPNGPAYQMGVDIKVGEKYCLLCGVQLGEEFHSCPVLAEAPTREGIKMVTSDALPDHITGILFNSKMFDGTDDFIGDVLDEPAEEPNPNEPGLCETELIAVRQMLEERFGRAL